MNSGVRRTLGQARHSVPAWPRALLELLKATGVSWKAMAGSFLLLMTAALLGGDAAAHTDRALERFGQHDFQGALAEFEEALTKLPESPIVRVNLGWACYYAGQFESASQHFRAALARNGNDPFAHFPLGVLAKAHDRLEDALLHFNAVLSVDGADPATLYQIGQIEMRRGNYASAVRLFRSSLDGQPDEPSTLYNLARALIRSGNQEEGRRLMKRFQAMQRRGQSRMMGGMSEPTLVQGKYAQLRRIGEGKE